MGLGSIGKTSLKAINHKINYFKHMDQRDSFCNKEFKEKP
jgi:hypothetical protein